VLLDYFSDFRFARSHVRCALSPGQALGDRVGDWAAAAARRALAWRRGLEEW